MKSVVLFKTILFRYRLLVTLLLVSLVFCTLYLVTRSAAYHAHYILPRAVAFDLVITLPLLYFLLIRKTKVPVLTVIPVFFLSMFLGEKWGQQADGFFLAVNQNKVYIAEALFITLESLMVYHIRKIYKKVNRGYAFFREDMYLACYNYFKTERIAHIMATEITMFYYLFSRYKPEHSAQVFSYHKKSGKVLTIFFVMLLMVESLGLHLLVQQWNHIAAWVLTFSSLYLVLVLVAHYRAAVRLPVVLTEKGLLLRNGLLYSTFIPYDHIAHMHASAFSSATRNKKPLYINTMAELGSINLVIDLKEEMETIGLYGTKKKFDTIALELDDKKEFLQAINVYLNR